MKNSQEKMPYLRDGEIYSIWKYLNGFRLVRRTLLNFDDIIPSKENKIFVAKFFNLLNDLGIKNLNGLTFAKDAYLQIYKPRYEKFKKEKNEGSLDSVSLKAFELLEKILVGDVDVLYKGEMGIFDFIFYESRLGILEFFEFLINLLPQNKKRLAVFIKKYIENFTNDNLQKNRNNFYCFNKQRKNLLNEFHFKEQDYGSSFIFEYPKEADTVFGVDQEFLFIHTLISLEELGYIKIEEIWIFDMDLSPEQQTETYKVKLRLEDRFFKERDKAMSEKMLSKSSKKTENIMFFDDKKSILLFDNKEIAISKTRNSNGHYLLKTIFKDKDKDWEFDEIADDWSEEYRKNDWKKYYYAGYAVNEKVAKETTIKDFLTITSKTICINKNYL